MNPARLPAILVLACALALAACGNKADLFMPPPPEDEGLLEDPVRGEAVDEGVSADEAATPAASGLPLPVPTGEDAGQPVPPPPADDGPEPPPPDPDGGG